MRRSTVRSPAIVDNHPPKMDPAPSRHGKTAPHLGLFPRFSSSPSNPKSAKCDIRPLLASAAVAIAVSFSIFLLAAVVRASWSRARKGYGIVIDGGSTGTRIHVFEYWEDRGELNLDLKNGGVESLKVVPGLSSYRDDPEGAGRALAELLAFGRERIPREYWNGTEVRLMATAGLRLLDVEVQDRILEACRRVLRSSPFRFSDDWASVITGSEEGIYAWVAANYALGSLGDEPQKTTGIIELGGASVQVTFVSSEQLPPEFSHTLKFGRFQYTLYSHSLLQFGQNAASDLLYESVISKEVISSSAFVKIDPCTPRGYDPGALALKLSPGVIDGSGAQNQLIHARGNFSECRSAASMLLQKGKDRCMFKHCRIGSNFVPKLHGKFLATENFFYTSKFFKLPSAALLSDVQIAGQQFCGEDWQKLKRRYYHLQDEELLPYCFSSAYIVALLHDGLGIALDDDRIEFVNQVRGIPLDWAIGAFILQKTADKGNEQGTWVSHIVDNDSSSFLSILIISAFLLFVIWSLLKWKKPHLKTIYDLEKGRYIVRVSK